MPRIPVRSGSRGSLSTVTSRSLAPNRDASPASTVPDTTAPITRPTEPSAATTYTSARIRRRHRPALVDCPTAASAVSNGVSGRQPEQPDLRHRRRGLLAEHARDVPTGAVARLVPAHEDEFVDLAGTYHRVRAAVDMDEPSTSMSTVSGIVMFGRWASTTTSPRSSPHQDGGVPGDGGGGAIIEMSPNQARSVPS